MPSSLPEPPKRPNTSLSMCSISLLHACKYRVAKDREWKQVQYNSSRYAALVIMAIMLLLLYCQKRWALTLFQPIWNDGPAMFPQFLKLSGKREIGLPSIACTRGECEVTFLACPPRVHLHPEQRSCVM